MLSPDACWFCLAAAMISLIGGYTFLRWQQRLNRRQSIAAQQAAEQLAQHIAILESRLVALESDVAALKATGYPTPLNRSPPNLIDEIEHLADDTQLGSSNALSRAASAIEPGAPTGWIDPFDGHGEMIAIARLADQDLSAGEISRRLQKPLGEIELLLSLRPVRDAA